MFQTTNQSCIVRSFQSIIPVGMEKRAQVSYGLTPPERTIRLQSVCWDELRLSKLQNSESTLVIWDRYLLASILPWNSYQFGNGLGFQVILAERHKQNTSGIHGIHFLGTRENLQPAPAEPTEKSWDREAENFLGPSLGLTFELNLHI